MAARVRERATPTHPTLGGSIGTRRKYFFIINRQSGNYLKWLVQMRVGEFLTTEGITGEVHYLRDTDTLKARLSQACQEGYRDFVVVGGDGSVSLVASLLRGKDCHIGIVPVGTSNTLAQVLGIPLGARRSLELLLSPDHTRAADGLDIEGRLYFLNASAGLSSFSVSDLRPVEKSYLKIFAYVLAVIRSMRKAKTRRFTVTVAGETTTLDAAELFVDNAGVLATPRYRTSNAEIDDGLAAVWFIRKGTPPEMGNAVLDVILLRKKRLSIQLLARAATVSVDCAEQIPVQADGDIIGHTPVDISVVPSVARFIVPEGRGKGAAPIPPHNTRATNEVRT